MAGVEGNVDNGGRQWYGDDDDGLLRRKGERELAPSDEEVAGMRMKRTACQMHALERRGELAGGEELLLQWWSGLRRTGGGASDWGTASSSPRGVAVKRARGRGRGRVNRGRNGGD